MSLTSESKLGSVGKSANSLAVMVGETVMVVIEWAVETGVLVEGTGRKKDGDNLCT